MVCLRESCTKSEIYCMWEKELVEKPLSSLLVLSLCDFYEKNTAREKEFHIILQKLLDHVLAQGFKKALNG